ncbi:heme lyase CcmF/NrfE family subunit [uncultured Amaricoccus sp.]|uniref:heme lyase CcmF/NrfE family subunit n=1 Tax=uncultured Amaricoccus sp. TaxID=339341 RepID=UPI00261897CF|nr:heme lyase CcmF/NrfE family subunit [uncultured Amaricoccus sp.]
MEVPLVRVGGFAAALALALCLFAVAQAAAAARGRSPARLVAARNAVFAVAGLVSFAFAVLVHAFVVSDLSVAYVAQNSNHALPMLYKVTAAWGAHEGSLLLWSLYLALLSALAVGLHWRDHPLSMPWIIATLALVQAGFLALIVFLSNPFATLAPVPADGRDLNPLLQDPGLAFHPPVLYLGYVGFAVPFAFAVAAMVRRHIGTEWVGAVRRWVLFAWAALTSGIIFGGFWAYYELGWGGYWAWDPVENASLMPWLTGTALMHSMMAQERRHMFRLWNVFLVVSTFLLTLLGTFLVRSGVLTSVHAFAVDPGRGSYILVFMALAMVAGYGLVIWRAEDLESEAGIEHPLSREAGLLANNVLLLMATLIVVVGTLFPLAVDVVTGAKVSVGAPYFNRVMVPLMLAVVVLLAMGPSVPWRGMPGGRFVRQFRAPALGAAAAFAGAAALGVGEALTLVAIAVVAFAASAVLADLGRAVIARRKVAGCGWARAVWMVLSQGRRRTGGLIVHLGIVAIAAGMIGSGLFQQALTVEMRPGEATRIHDVVLTLRGIEDIEGANWQGRLAHVSVSREGKVVAMMAPGKRFYPLRGMATTETAIHSELGGDLYIFVGDERDGGIVAQIYWNPLVSWIWVGWMVVLAGALLSLSEPERQRRAVVVRPAAALGVPAE